MGTLKGQPALCWIFCLSPLPWSFLCFFFFFFPVDRAVFSNRVVNVFINALFFNPSALGFVEPHVWTFSSNFCSPWSFLITLIFSPLTVCSLLECSACWEDEPHSCGKKNVFLSSWWLNKQWHIWLTRDFKFWTDFYFSFNFISYWLEMCCNFCLAGTDHLPWMMSFPEKTDKSNCYF